MRLVGRSKVTPPCRDAGKSTDRCKTLRMSYDPLSPPPSSRTQRPSVNDDEAPKPQDISVERANGPAQWQSVLSVVLCRCVLFRVVPAKEVQRCEPAHHIFLRRAPSARRTEDLAKSRIEGSRTMRNRPYPVLKCSRTPSTTFCPQGAGNFLRTVLPGWPTFNLTPPCASPSASSGCRRS